MVTALSSYTCSNGLVIKHILAFIQLKDWLQSSKIVRIPNYQRAIMSVGINLHCESKNCTILFL